MSSSLRIASGRATLAAESAGSGEPVVFVHARVADRRMWRGQLRDIGANNQAIAYDRRGFGETRAEPENFSAVADLVAVIDAVSIGEPVILVECSQGGGIVLDATLQHPSYVRALVLIAPSVTGAPEGIHPSKIENLLVALREAERIGDVDQALSIRTRLYLDGPLEPAGRVTGEARDLFLDMNSAALRLPPTGTNLDASPAYHRLGEVSVPTFVMCGDLDIPSIQERSRYVAATVSDGIFHQLSGVAHLPSLERPEEVTSLIVDFIDRCSDQR
jgi:pimeloyl-ACP methyl ester carboxylesterase